MKIKIKKSCAFFIVCSAILCASMLSSCVTEEKLAYTNDQINLANKRISSAEESSQKNLEPINQKLDLITSNQAALRVEIDQLKDSMRNLSGRVEENENLVKHSVEKDLTTQDTTRTDLTSLSSRLSKIEATVNQQQKYLNIDEGQQAPPQANAGAAPSGTGGQPAAAQDSGEKYSYDSSLALYNDGKFADAISGFKKFLEQYPKSDLAGNAQFWIGECLMNQKEYEQAILAFEDVVKKYPRNIKVPNAMLRQAIAFLEINDKTSSTVLLKKVIKQFPKTNEAKLAQKKLDTMK